MGDSSTTRTTFGNKDQKDLMSSGHRRWQRCQSSIGTVFEAVATALRLNDEISASNRQMCSQITPSQHNQLPTPPTATTPPSPPSPQISLVSERTLVTSNTENTQPLEVRRKTHLFDYEPIRAPEPPGQPTSRRTTRVGSINDAALSTLAEHIKTGTPTKESRGGIISKNYTLGMHGDDIDNGDNAEDSSDSFAIMKDIQQDMKDTRRLHELYNLKDGRSRPKFDSSRHSVEAGGNHVTVRYKKALLERRYSAKTA